MRDDVLIVGAGISGLVLAKQLAHNGVSVRLLEARPVVGGRLRGEHSIDLGAAWSWSTDQNVRRLAKELGIKSFEQPASGMAVIDSRWGRHEQRDDGAAGPGAVRFEGGAVSLAVRLADSLDVPIHLTAPVQAIRVNTSSVRCETPSGQFNARCVVVTAPPRVALGIEYEPPLPRTKRDAMSSIATWMGDTMKVGMLFEQPFWRDNGYSGAVFSDRGPLSQIWDNSDDHHGIYALAGFAFGTHMETLKDMDDAHVESTVTSQFSRAFGVAVPKPTAIVRTAWKDEPFTYATALGRADTHHYGLPQLSVTHAERVFFAGTETDPEHGHLEGAVRSGLLAADRIFDFLAAEVKTKPASCDLN